MARSRVILPGFAAALAGAVSAMLLTAWLSWNISLQAEQTQLQSVAQRIVDRTDLSVTEAKRALKALSALSVPPCSPANIHVMQQLVMNTHSVDQFGYAENRVLKCTSWGQVDVPISQGKGDFTTPDGFEVTMSTTPLVTGGDPVMALRYGPYNALISAGRFVDLAVDDRVHLALAASDGTIVAESATPGREVVPRILAGGRTPGRGRYLGAVVRQGNWIAVALERKPGMLPYLRDAWRWLLAVGAFVGLVVFVLTVRLFLKSTSLLAELRTAVKRKEFVVHYQPIVDLDTGRCSGAEALVRWRRADGSMVRPDRFIPLAEESGLIVPITDQVIETVVREMKAALAADSALHVAINLCAEDIRTARVLPVLSKRLGENGVSARQIWLEATEREFVDLGAACATLSRAREMGHTTAIDDFGTGYSSLQYLHGLPVDVLKIDKSFVGSIGKDAVSSPIIGHIIDMAQSLGLTLVAEGVETQEQADYLAARGVEFAQGWLYSRALPADEFLRFYRRAPGASVAGGRARGGRAQQGHVASEN
ncbi:EAL domain-containing protein [Burkholderia sp. WAC0059]|uniref:EAL domain-containing protein n=1 Tax=Burkholderia sp. WAC0059 TaxID=2066022 RepID=UPI0015E12A7D|nr:EAL domain-containing protein [Burkholderia sp. WAC0059]